MSGQAEGEAEAEAEAEGEGKGEAEAEGESYVSWIGDERTLNMACVGQIAGKSWPYPTYQ